MWEFIMRSYLLILFCLTALLGCTAEQKIPQAADAIYINGKIWTGDPDTPWAEGLAVKGDRLVAVDNAKAVSKWRG